VVWTIFIMFYGDFINLGSIKSPPTRGVMRRLSHETRQYTRLGSQE